MERGGADVYGGACGQTRSELCHFACACGALISGAVHRSVNNSRDPALGAKVREGSQNRISCGACGQTAAVAVPVVYHDEEKKLLALVLPDSLRHRELEERADLYLQLARDRAHAVPDYARVPEVVYGAAGLAAAIDRIDARAARAAAEQSGADEQRRREQALEARLADLETRERALAEREQALRELMHEASAREQALREREGPQSGTGPYERVDDDDIAEATPLPINREAREAREARADATRVTSAEARDLAVERWIVTRAPTLVLAERDHVRFCATVSAEQLEALLAGELLPRLQLFTTPAGPLAVLSVAPAGVETSDATTVAALLDPQRLDDRAVLGTLAHGFRVQLDLYDKEYMPVAKRQLEAPLEENAQLCARAAEEQLAAPGMARRDFDAAVAFYRKEGVDRHGRRAQSLEQDSFSHLPSAATALVALTVVGFWSEPENQDYLIYTRGFPMPWWQEIKKRVVARAVAAGLALPPPLAQAAIAEELARSRKDLAQKLATEFARTAADPRCDLDAAQVQENWRALVAECESLGVPLEGAAAEAAARAVGADAAVPEPILLTETEKKKEVELARRRIASASEMVRGEIAPKGGANGKSVDLEKLGIPELVARLDDKDARRDAAIALCRRGDPAAVGPVFGALRRMNRGEAVRVLPMVVRFGERAVPHLVDGLRSRKNFLRQGCALALAMTKSADGIDALVDLLLAEPTEVWKEVARALGELGGGAVMSLAARLREAPADRRERVAWALAHVAERGGRGQVETLAGGRDQVASQVARRALELSAEARDSDAQVRGARSGGDQTVNRAFSRRFFEALSAGAGDGAGTGEVELLDEADLLEEDEELLDDEDLLPG